MENIASAFGEKGSLSDNLGLTLFLAQPAHRLIPTRSPATTGIANTGRNGIGHDPPSQVSFGCVLGRGEAERLAQSAVRPRLIEPGPLRGMGIKSETVGKPHRTLLLETSNFHGKRADRPSSPAVTIRSR